MKLLSKEIWLHVVLTYLLPGLLAAKLFNFFSQHGHLDMLRWTSSINNSTIFCKHL